MMNLAFIFKSYKDLMIESLHDKKKRTFSKSILHYNGCP